MRSLMSGHRHPNSWGSQRGLLESSLDDEGTLRNKPVSLLFPKIRQAECGSISRVILSSNLEDKVEVEALQFEGQNFP
jgi:hypothetical protein